MQLDTQPTQVSTSEYTVAALICVMLDHSGPEIQTAKALSMYPKRSFFESQPSVLFFCEC